MRKLEDTVVSRAIIDEFFKRLRDNIEVDVAIVGGGPAGIIAAHDLACMGHKVALFERKLSIGGGMWGGGMMFNIIVIQTQAAKILNELGVKTKPYEIEGYHTSCAVNTMATLAAKATDAGAIVFNGIFVEDVVWDGNSVGGVVVNWSAADVAGLHVDPLTVQTKCVLDATGHDIEVVRTLVRKNGVNINTPTGDVAGETSMFAIQGEEDVVRNTVEVYPGMFVAGMAANAAFGGQRMGPVFGGMILSGKKAAKLIHEKIGTG